MTAKHYIKGEMWPGYKINTKSAKATELIDNYEDYEDTDDSKVKD